MVILSDQTFVLSFVLAADWIMIKYKGGQNYHNHCNGKARSAVVMLTCDPGVSKVDM